MPIYRVMAPGTGRHQLDHWRRSALHTAALLLLIVGGCTLGLLLLDPGTAPLDRKAFDALWNAINLVTTLGSFTTLSWAQQQFLLVTMLAALMIGGFALTTLTGILSSPEVLIYRETRRMEKILAKLAGHVVSVGFGPVGRRTALDLRRRGETVLVVEFEGEAAQAASAAGFLTIQASGARDEVHLKARVGEAKAMIVTLDDSDRKLALTMMTHAVNPDLPIIATELDESSSGWLSHAGATAVVAIDALIASTLIDQLATAPSPAAADADLSPGS